MLRIYTDTSANLTREIIDRYNLTVIPFHYTVEGTELCQDITKDFNGKEFYDAMRNGRLVKTSMVNVQAFCDAFEAGITKGDDIIYVGMSSGISGTYQASVMAANVTREKYPECKLAVIDTKAASLGEGLPVIYAASLVEHNKPFNEIVEKVTTNARNICQYFTVEDLEYLHRGGRVSKMTAIVGNMLGIKPILRGDNDGKIVLYHKARGRKKALDALAEQYSQLVLDKSLPIGIAHADSPDGAVMLEARLRERGLTGKVTTVCYEPVTGAHVGPGTVALFFYGTER